MNREFYTFYGLLFIGLFVSFASCTSTKDVVSVPQNPINYYDLNNKQVSEVEFKKLINYAYNIDVYRYFDTVTEAYIVIRHEEGKLTPEQLKAFKASIEQSGNIKISFDKPLRIVYYTELSERGECLTNERNSNYTKEVATEFSDYETLYIANSTYKFDQNKYDVIIDQDDVIEKLFFRQKHACSNILMIHADGNYGSCMADGCEYYEKK